MNWIKCSERMPELYVHVLAYDDTGSRFIGFAGHNRSWRIYGLEGLTYTKVTHWQPLPEPPKEDE